MDKPKSDGWSLFEIGRKYLTNAFKSTPECRYLVMDAHAARIVQRLFDKDLCSLALNDHEFEIHSDRETMDIPGLYLVDLNAFNVDCIVADMHCRRYTSFHIYYYNLFPDPQLLKKLWGYPSGVERQVLPFNLNFLVRESRLICPDDPLSFPILYHEDLPPETYKIPHLKKLAEMIVSLCIALDEYPLIRFFKHPKENPLNQCRSLAEIVSDTLTEFHTQSNRQFPGSRRGRPRALLYILDRTMDLVAPFIHERTYQAVAWDLVPVNLVEGDRIMYACQATENQTGPEKQQLHAKEPHKEEIKDDPYWMKYRHWHFSDVLGSLNEDSEKLKAFEARVQGTDKSTHSAIVDLRDTLTGAKDHQAHKAALAMHTALAEEIRDENRARCIKEFSSLEHMMATGKDSNNEAASQVTQELVEMLARPTIIDIDKIRLLALYPMFRDGIILRDIENLVRHSRLELGVVEAMKILHSLGAPMIKPNPDKRAPAVPLLPVPEPQFTDEQGPKLKKSLQDDYNKSCRIYTCMLKRLLKLDSLYDEKNIQNSNSLLPEHLFPFLQIDHSNGELDEIKASQKQSSLRQPTYKPTWAQTSEKPKQKVIVFMMGGATYSELKTCYDMAASTHRDIYLMTPQMITPTRFIAQLKWLHERPNTGALQAATLQQPTPLWVLNASNPKQSKASPEKPSFFHSTSGSASEPPADEMGNLAVGDEGKKKSKWRRKLKNLGMK